MVSRTWVGGLLLLWTLLAAQAAVPEGYPADYAEIVAAAKTEGTVVVYSPTDLAEARPLIADFKSLYPGVSVDYRELDSARIYESFLKESTAGSASADVLWSSAMDLQVKLVNDGHALHYPSPESDKLPAWAVWKSEAYGTTLEPVGFAYDRRQLSAEQVPQTHRAFIELLKSDPARFKGRTVTYDLENSGIGFLYASQDAKASSMLWDVAAVLGASHARQLRNSAAMLDSLAAGESLLAYNVLGSYASSKRRADPSIGFVYPKDYTLVGSRIAFINKRAAHPNAAKLWLDYLLSQRGQVMLANQAGLFALRSDVQGQTSAVALKLDAGAAVKPVVIGPGLMAYLDRGKRQEFLKRWKELLAPKE